MAKLIFGCGYLGLSAARLWLANNETVFAVTRSRTDTLTRTGIRPILADVLQPNSLKDSLSLLAAEDIETLTVLYAIAPDRQTPVSFHELYVTGLTHALENLGKVAKFIYISSTSVYGQTNGEWVDETSPTAPAESNGQSILEAENRVRQFSDKHYVFRLSGIYGPGRILRRAALERGELYQADPNKWLNLIYRDDAAEAILAADASTEFGTYCISDGSPVTRRDFYTETTRVIEAPPARFAETTTSIPEPNRRVSSRFAQTKLGWSPKHPTFKEGLQAAIREEKDHPKSG